MIVSTVIWIDEIVIMMVNTISYSSIIQFGRVNKSNTKQYNNNFYVSDITICLALSFTGYHV